MMRRRRFIIGVGAAALAAPLAARGQPTGKARRIGFLDSTTLRVYAHSVRARVDILLVARNRAI